VKNPLHKEVSMSEFQSNNNNLDDHFEKTEEACRDILGDDLLKLGEHFYEIRRKKNGRRVVKGSFKFSDKVSVKFIEPVDPKAGPMYAFYKALHSQVFSQFPSLSSLILMELRVKSKGKQTKTVETDIGFSAAVEVVLEIRNKKGNFFTWKREGYDFIEVSFGLVLQALLFFSNSELAYKIALKSYLVGGSKDDKLLGVVTLLNRNGDYVETSKVVRAEAQKMLEENKSPYGGGISTECLNK